MTQRPSTGWSFESRASIALKVGAAFILVVSLLVLGPAIGRADSGIGDGLVQLTGVGLILVVYLVEAIGLDRRLPWAVAAARPLLAIVVLVGVVNAIGAVGAGRLLFPLDAILGFWALLGDPETPHATALGGRGVAVVAGYLAATVVTAGSGPLFGAGGVFDVHRVDLRGRLEAACATTADGQTAIDVTYRWSWTRGTLLPSGLDGIALTWNGVGPEVPYVLGETGAVSPGVVPGLSGSPSSGMLDQVMSGAPGQWTWGVELADQRYGPGELHARLLWARPDMSPDRNQPIQLVATYVHLGAWQEATYLTWGCPA